MGAFYRTKRGITQDIDLTRGIVPGDNVQNEKNSTQPPLPVNHLPLLRLVGQVGATYLVAEGPDGLYLIDQHAAHERVLFEKFMNQGENPPALKS